MNVRPAPEGGERVGAAEDEASVPCAVCSGREGDATARPHSRQEVSPRTGRHAARDRAITGPKCLSRRQAALWGPTVGGSPGKRDGADHRGDLEARERDKHSENGTGKAV